jgi:hypothetical protein
MVDESTKKTLSNIPLLQTKAGPRDKDLWVQRLKEEYQGLIKVKSQYIIILYKLCKLPYGQSNFPSSINFID